MQIYGVWGICGIWVIIGVILNLYMLISSKNERASDTAFLIAIILNIVVSIPILCYNIYRYAVTPIKKSTIKKYE